MCDLFHEFISALKNTKSTSIVRGDDYFRIYINDMIYKQPPYFLRIRIEKTSCLLIAHIRPPNCKNYRKWYKLNLLTNELITMYSDEDVLDEYRHIYRDGSYLIPCVTLNDDTCSFSLVPAKSLADHGKGVAVTLLNYEDKICTNKTNMIYLTNAPNLYQELPPK